MTINIDNIDIYEVEKRDYEAYFYRLPPNEIIKTTPRPGLIVWKDIKENEEICGQEITQIMGQNCSRYFIFNFVDEERLGPHKTYQYITLSEEEYIEFLNSLPSNKEKTNGEDLSNSCESSER